MTKKYAKFLPCAEEFNLENFPYYWVTQVHAQYVLNVDHALKSMVSIIHVAVSCLLLKPNHMPAFLTCQKWSYLKCRQPPRSFIA